MTEETERGRSGVEGGEMKHDVPEWYMPDGPVRIGGDVGADDLDGEGMIEVEVLTPTGRKTIKRSPREHSAIENGHRMHGVGRDANRDHEGTLSCLSCSCDGRDLELIECPARHLEHTHVSLCSDQLEQLRRRAEQTGRPATPTGQTSPREERQRLRDAFKPRE